MKYIISASILSADFSKLEKEIRACEDANVDWIHIDVMDGHFVPNLTMGPFIVEACRRITSLPLDCHLMVEKPENLVKSFVDAGATFITIHPENNPNIYRTLQLIRTLGARPGAALNPGTHASVLQPLLPILDIVLLMTANPGFSGGQFIPGMIDKVAQVKQLILQSDQEIPLEVDGGVSSDTIKKLAIAGATAFVSASSIFKTSMGIIDSVRVLRESLK